MNAELLDKKYIANTYSRTPVVLTSAKGSLVYDENGREYIDLGSGIAVNSFGTDDEWIAAVTAQLGQIQHTSNLFYSSPDALLAEQLCLRTGMKKVFFSNSGAEANECAIKAARKYAAGKKGSDCYTVVTLKNSFHGRTLATLAATGQDAFHKDFQPLPAGFVHTAANDVTELENTLKSVNAAAVMFEPVQGEGGVIALEQSFVNSIFELCAKHDIVTIADEVQTGNGRSGYLYAYMKYGISPDIVTTAKGLGGGLPIGATLFSDKCADVLCPGDHGSTFGGNPVCCAGALNVLSRIDDALLSSVREKSEFIVSQLTGTKGVVSVTGMGLMLGIETVGDANAVIDYCRNHGVLVIKAKNKVRLLPALNISNELLSKAVQIIKEGCEQAV